MTRQLIAVGFVRSPLLIFTLAGVSLCFAGSVRGSITPEPGHLLDHIGWTVADFDGDNQPDLVITQTQGRGYLLQFQLSGNREGGAPGRTLFPPLPSAFGLHLTPRDVDGDHDLDIVITSGFARQPVAVWINDGQGRFEEGDLTAYPAAEQGADATRRLKRMVTATGVVL